MPDVLADQYRRWFVYERDAHAKAFASLDTVPADRRGGAESAKAVALMGHLVVVRQVWLHRLGAGPPPAGALMPGAPAADRPTVRAEWERAAAGWDAYLAGLGDADLGRVFDWRSLDGGHFRNTVGDTLAHLFGHSAYHRGQVAVLVRAAGGTPALTDFTYWCREPVA